MRQKQSGIIAASAAGLTLLVLIASEWLGDCSQRGFVPCWEKQPPTCPALAEWVDVALLLLPVGIAVTALLWAAVVTTGERRP